MSKTEKAISYAEQMANDNTHGYSQVYRWPEEGTSFDCSSLVISAWEYAGVPVRTRGATYTGNMYSVFMSVGFEDVTKTVSLSSGSGLIRGDILLNHVNHTAMCCGNGKLVHARSSEGTSDQRDNSGNEIRIQSYWNYPWDCVLRYKEPASSDTEDQVETENEEYKIPEPDIPYAEYEEPINLVDVKYEASVKELEVHICRPGEFSWFVYGMQALLRGNNYYPQIDGKFQALTADWFLQFQHDRGLEEDCECGILSWNELFKNKNLRITDSGYAVQAAQYLLRAQGYYVGDGEFVDGIFGSNVYMQIKRFQEARGLRGTGRVDNETWNQLIIF